MQRFVYSPDVMAFVMTDDGEILDLSPDIISGSVTRNLDALSRAELILQNPHNKYTRTRVADMPIRPMDRIVIFLQRIHRPTQVFTGYVDDAPFQQLYPQPVRISASCTLKRLQHTYFDPSLPAVSRMLRKYGWNYDFSKGTLLSGKNLQDFDVRGGIGHLIMGMMHDIGGWQIGGATDRRGTVHIMKLPQAFINKTSAAITAQSQATKEERELVESTLSKLMTVEGIFDDPMGTESDFEYDSNYSDSAPLPQDFANSYLAKIYGPPYDVSGLAVAFVAEMKKVGYTISGAQGQVAAEIFYVARKKGWRQTAAAGWVGAAHPESNYIPTAVNASSGATGVFQLLSDSFYGPNGHLAKEIYDLKGIRTSPVKGGAEAKNVAYNTGAIMRDGAVNTYRAAIQDNLNDPHTIITMRVIRPEEEHWVVGSPYWNKAHKAFLAMKRALASIASQPVATAAKYADVKGVVGDVRVSPFGEEDLPTVTITPKTTTTRSADGTPTSQTTTFEIAGSRKQNQATIFPLGKTFRIKNNPYDDEHMIFRSVAYNNKLKYGQIEIYVPGAANDSTPEAKAWRNKNVTLETSAGRATRFQPATNALPKKKPLQWRKMTDAQLRGGGVSLDGIMPITKAGLAYIQANFGFFRVNSARGGRSAGDHSRGLALDLAPLNRGGAVSWGAEEIARTDALARWLGYTFPSSCVPAYGGPINVNGKNPAVRYVAWKNVVGHGPPTGNRCANPSGPHLHVSFNASAGSDQFPDIDGNPGGAFAVDTTSVAGVNLGDAASMSLEQLARFNFSTSLGTSLTFPGAGDAITSQIFRGDKALANDVSFLEWIQWAVAASGRSFQSQPNGDFLAFYPDYFNWAGTAPYWKIEDIEIKDLNISISDQELVSHLFVTGDTFYGNDTANSWFTKVASVQSTAAFSKFVNIKPGTNLDDWSTRFLQRYGARPRLEKNPALHHPIFIYMYAWREFLRQWSRQFVCQADFTFMPELYPGGLVRLGSNEDLTMFIESVTHTFDRAGGFSTTASLTAPSSTNYESGMVLLGGQSVLPDTTTTGNTSSSYSTSHGVLAPLDEEAAQDDI